MRPAVALRHAGGDEPWIRVAGMLTLLLGYYYVQCARAELRRFFELSVGARGAVISRPRGFIPHKGIG